MYPICDAHCHCLGSAYSPVDCSLLCCDIQEVGDRMPHTDIPGVFLSAGIHPWDTERRGRGWFDTLESYVSSADIHVGECGLDYVRNKNPRRLQRDVFEKQLVLAVQYNRILTVHMQKGWDVFFELIQQHGIPQRGMILHDYSGSVEIMQSFSSSDPVFFSYGTSLLRKEGYRKKKEAFIHTPVNRILFESDAEDEQCCRGQLIYNCLARGAELKNCSEKELHREIVHNCNRLFFQQEK
ncbi:MAG: TatD family hydrolase [Fibrobacterota bacterium]